jgi:hypothetical protein
MDASAHFVADQILLICFIRQSRCGEIRWNKARRKRYHLCIMTLSNKDRERNNEIALRLIFEDLGEAPINLRIFLANDPLYAGKVDRTTWEDLAQSDYLEQVFATEGSRGYRLTPKGWILCLELTGASNSAEFKKRLGRIIGAMKRHVKGRSDPKFISPWELADESGEPFGLVFNVIDSRASSSLNFGRIGATWYKGERGQLVEIPVNFSMEPIDIAAGLTVEHLEKIEDLEARLQEVEEDRAKFHCPDCDAPLVGGGDQDFPEAHCIVTYENYACGLTLADGFEESPCPYGPRWPRLEEFEFRTESHGSYWSCYALAKTDRARRVSLPVANAATENEAEALARKRASPKKKGDPLW